jgi:glycine betaine/proline transport system ATP-binding protein
VVGTVEAGDIVSAMATPDYEYDDAADAATEEDEN